MPGTPSGSERPTEIALADIDAPLVLAFLQREVSRDELAGAVAMTASGGTFQAYLSDLRRSGLIEVRGRSITMGEALRKAA